MARSPLVSSSLALSLAVVFGASIAACQGCRGTPGGDHGAGATAPGTATQPKETPTARLYLLSTVAGALEPCGCSKAQLGGFDRFAALVAKEKTNAPSAITVSAGPLFFLDPTPRGAQKEQDDWKAAAIASSLAKVSFAGWAPGLNDWALGADRLAALGQATGGAVLAANLAGQDAGAKGHRVVEVGGVKIGLLGASAPSRMGQGPEGVTVERAAPAFLAAAEAAKAEGAKVLVALVAMPRGEALRLAESLPELDVLVVGKPFDQGEANDKAATPVLLGHTLVVETANHLQTVGVLDLFVRGAPAAGDLVFQDGASIAKTEERKFLDGRIDDLRRKVNAAQVNKVSGADLDAAKSELTKLEAERQKLENPTAPATGSFFKFTMMDVGEALGKDDAVHAEMLGFYKRVNESNKTTFAGKKPPEAAAGDATFVGVEACGKCHAGAKAVWEKTAHAGAYKTLQDGFKEFNLDCVSCHVTGYEKPGGSTVTMNDGLQNVQCESCHGAGSKHAASPATKGLITKSPPPDGCVSACHHPPHVEGFDPAKRAGDILRPGHGDPTRWPAPGPTP
jgi:2',3'-cyclic-nucleotide 2'-phosphodiesterase (5'-nucleotidase family)